MPTYVSLGSWTDQGVRGVKDTIKRAEAFVAAAERMNGKVRDIFWTMGAYDIVAITDGPNDEVASTLALGVAMQGNIRTVTMRAYTKEEMAKIVSRLP